MLDYYSLKILNLNYLLKIILLARQKTQIPKRADTYKLAHTRYMFFKHSIIIIVAQAIRIDKDGDDAKDLESYIVSSYLDCIKLCLNSPQCRYIVKSGQRCFLKATTPISGPCARNDECAVVLSNIDFCNFRILQIIEFSINFLAYSNEATLYDLPLNTTFKLQVQVYDSKSDLWSPPSQLSGLFSTNIGKNI